MLWLRFSDNRLFFCGVSFNEALRFNMDLACEHKHGPFFSLFGSDPMQSKHVAIASDSGDVRLFFWNENVI